MPRPVLVTIKNRIRLATMMLAAVVFLGAAGFHFIEGWPWFDGLYMTLITMTTVGYGETHPLTHAGQVFNIFLIIMAVVTGGFLVATATQAMLEFELSSFLGRRRMERELARMTDHYIVCGAGRVGRTVVHELRARGVPCVVIEKDAAHAQWAVDGGIPVVIGTGTTEEVLERARIRQAKGFISAVTSDADNLYIVLTASGMRPDLKIIARASEEEAIPKLLRAGASQVLSPYHFIGHRIVQLLLRPNVLDFVDAAFGSERLDVQIEEVRVPDSSPLAGKSLAEANMRDKCGVLVLALKRADGSLYFNPAPESIVQPGDYLIAIGGTDHLAKLEALTRP